MNKELIDYSALVDEAMHFIVKKSLEIFAKKGLDSDHHFFISFVTDYPGVFLPQKLRDKYPSEMTIVLQHQFEDLVVSEDAFSVVLSFYGKQERVVVPFSALTAFADPSVKFGLQFRHVEQDKIEGEYNADSFLADKSFYSKELKPEEEPSSKSKDNIIALDFKNKKLK